MKELSIGLITDLNRKSGINQFQACLDTWVDDNCYCFSGPLPENFDRKVPNLEIFPSSREIDLFFHGLKWLLDHQKSKFYLFLKTKSYLNLSRALKLVRKYDYQQRYYFGGHPEMRTINQEEIPIFHGGSGIILSHGLVELLFQIYTPEQLLIRWRNISDANDYALAAGYLAYLFFATPIESRYMLGATDHQVCLGERPNVGCHKKCEELRATPHKIIACNYMYPPIMREYHLSFQDWEKEIVPNWTLVTGFYNITKYGAPFYRSKKFYLDHGRFTLSLPVNLVIYCDEEDREYFSTFRRSLGFENQTRIICRELSSFQLFALKEKIIENREKSGHYPESSDRSSVYSILTNTKFDLVRLAIEDNWFSTDYYGWIDYGLCHVSGFYPHALTRALKVYRKKVSLCLMHYQAKSLVLDFAEYNSIHRFGLCGGLILGRKDYLLPMLEKGIEYFQETVEAGYGHFEEQILHLVYHRHPDFFSLHFGDYHQVLSNYDRIRSNPNIIINLVVKNCRVDANYQLGEKACQHLLHAVLEDQLEITPYYLITLLDEYFIISYYLDKTEECISILNFHHYFAQEYGDEYLEEFSYSRRVIENSDYLRYKLDNFQIKEFDYEPEDLSENSEKEDSNQKIVIYGDYPISPQSLIINRIIYRPSDLRL